MISLLQNEWTKLWSKKQPWIFLGVLLVISIGVAILFQTFGAQDGAAGGEDWEAGLQMEIQQQEQIIAETEEDWERDMAEQRIDDNEAMLAAGVNPNETSNVTFLNEGLFMGTMFITLFSVITASTIVSSEQDNGTLKHLFVRPFERWQFLLAKFLTVILFGIVMIITVVSAKFLIGTILFGTGSFDTPVGEFGMNGMIFAPVSELLPQKLGLYFLNMLMFVVFAFSISILFKSQTLAVGIGIFILFGTNVLGAVTPLLQDYFWYPYVFLPHMSLQSYVAVDEIMPGVGIGFSLTVLAVYAVVFLGAATAFFQKRDLA
ncbi:hypothetical protein CR205_12590 [Alteribacter lacisalsi]|uniref:ABC transporter permease n=1 Tax=Alteribacter lacisalsi TaxID=2045244 RepID=A0A2W0H736_9BACI|nr:ABC transporter permease subunit [Alteribacter lacisalsi]PYZ96546.1 hypothetical protein CR205_12590 [Alteribacter lacisalsi]